MDSNPDLNDQTPPPRERSPARTAALPWILVRRGSGGGRMGPVERPEAAPARESARHLLTALQKQNRPTVFTAQLIPVVSSDDNQLFGVVKSRR